MARAMSRIASLRWRRLYALHTGATALVVALAHRLGLLLDQRQHGLAVEPFVTAMPTSQRRASANSSWVMRASLR